MAPKRAGLVALLLASVLGQIAAASASATHKPEIAYSLFAAMAFVLAGLRFAWLMNAPWWTPTGDGLAPSSEGVQPTMAARNGELVAIGYAWGGLSLLGIYTLTTLRWQHGWEYGLGMLVIAGIISQCTRTLPSRRWSYATYKALTAVTALHAIAALLALAWLIASGKILSVKGDWAANVVFLSGGILIVGVSAIGLRTARALEVAGNRPPVSSATPPSPLA